MVLEVRMVRDKNRSIMGNFKYQLAKKGKAICPECERKTFVLYVDTITGEPLHSTVGKCDRADNCGHHYTPRQYSSDNNISFDKKKYDRPALRTPKPQPKPSYIDSDVFKKSLRIYDQNNLISYLCSIVGEEATCMAIQRYFIGTSKHWENSTVFWQIDANGKVRAGKIMQYNPLTGRRVKEPTNRITWVHRAMKLQDFNLSQCLFGEHLLSTDRNRPVAIVESEKTAIIASCYYPSFIWLACGGCGNLNPKLCESLRGRNVILFPDIKQYNEWKRKAKTLSILCNISVSSLLEKRASENERNRGFDLADYLVQFSPSDFGKVTPQQLPKDKIYPAFVADNGTLYIPTPPDKKTTYTVYPSIEAYNDRTVVPHIVSMAEINRSNMKQIFIDLEILKISCKLQSINLNGFL